MKKFDVEITETLQRTVSVEADSRAEAERLVTEAWNNEDYVLDSTDFVGVDFKTVGEQELSENRKMEILLVQPGMYPQKATIGTELKDFQDAVGGTIAASYPFDDPVAIVYNDEGKLTGLPLNRALRDEHGQMYTFDIVMAVFDLTQKVVSDSSGIIVGNTRVNDIGLSMLQSSLMQMDVGPLFGLFLQSFFIGITMRILSIIIFVIVYGRMIEIYCMVSLAPIPMATWGNHEQSHMGQNYLKCLFALGFQGFLILICVAIYAVLIQSVAISGDAINSIWSIVGYTVLLCFSLFKTSSVTKSVLGAH